MSPWRVELNFGIIRQEEAKEVLARRAEVLIPQPDPVLKPYISELRICGEDCFNDMTSTCTTSATRFAKGTKLNYVSFQLNDMPTGQMFQHKWYRNGETFKELTDFYDGAWPGYTFLVLSRFSSGLFRAMFAMKEIKNGKEIHRRVSS